MLKSATRPRPERETNCVALRPTVMNLAAPLTSSVTLRNRLVFSAPHSPLSVERIRMPRVLTSRFSKKGWEIVAPERSSLSPTVSSKSARSSAYGRPATAASWARFILEEETNCIARVICRVFLTDLIRRRMSRRLAIYFRIERIKN